MTLTCLRCSCDKDVVVVTTDTDILVVSLMLLMFHWGKGMKIHMLSNTSSSKDVVKKMWKIKDVVKATGDIITIVHSCLVWLQSMDKVNIQINPVAIRNPMEYFLTA